MFSGICELFGIRVGVAVRGLQFVLMSAGKWVSIVKAFDLFNAQTCLNLCIYMEVWLATLEACWIHGLRDARGEILEFY